MTGYIKLDFSELVDRTAKYRNYSKFPDLQLTQVGPDESMNECMFRRMSEWFNGIIHL